MKKDTYEVFFMTPHGEENIEFKTEWGAKRKANELSKAPKYYKRIEVREIHHGILMPKA